MFESILNNILQKQLGNFILGLDPNNLKLGVWSGNIVIENVSIKPDIIQMLELPLNLNFSSVGKLKISIPWSRLSSSPVEVVLEDVFIILTPQRKDDWKFSDLKGVTEKLEMIENYSKQYLKKFMEKQKNIDGSKEKKKESGLNFFIFYIIKKKIDMLKN